MKVEFYVENVLFAANTTVDLPDDATAIQVEDRFQEWLAKQISFGCRYPDRTRSA